MFLPRKFHRERSLVGYSPWGREESDTTEQLSLHTCVCTHTHTHTHTHLAMPGSMQALSSLIGVKPLPVVLGVRTLNHWTARKAPWVCLCASVFTSLSVRSHMVQVTSISQLGDWSTSLVMSLVFLLLPPIQTFHHRQLDLLQHQWRHVTLLLKIF